PPLAVEPGRRSVRSDLAESDLRQKLAARLVLREDPREKLPHAAALALPDEGVHRRATGARPACVASDIHRELGDAQVAGARPILAGGSPRDHSSVPLDDDRGPPRRTLAQTARDVVGGAR